MKIDPVQHRAQPWRVHRLAPDFQLHDVWEIPIDGTGPDRFARFADLAVQNSIDTGSPIVSTLVAIRGLLGWLFRWDQPFAARPIPGCVEAWVADRLTAEDRATSQVTSGFIEQLEVGPLRRVYRFPNESLVELSNATVHALLHLSWPEGEGTHPRLAIYVKSRGSFTKLYLAAIDPFRLLFVYPAWIARIIRLWHEDDTRIH